VVGVVGAALAVVCSPAFGGSVTVKGVVTDAAQKKPLKLAWVQVRPTCELSGSTELASTSTGTDGSFEVQVTTEASELCIYAVEVSHTAKTMTKATKPTPVVAEITLHKKGKLDYSVFVNQYEWLKSQPDVQSRFYDMVLSTTPLEDGKFIKLLANDDRLRLTLKQGCIKSMNGCAAVDAAVAKANRLGPELKTQKQFLNIKN
jgi:hypothetical protein